MEAKVVYFAERGKGNTDEVLKLVKEKAASAGIKRVVMASTRSYTAERALELCPELEMVVVGIGRATFDERLLGRLGEQGVPVIFSREIDYAYPQDMRVAFRRFGQGTKVAVEVALLAVKAGLVPEGERVIGIGGSDAGADTALVLTVAADFRQIWVSEVLCKPL